jgi:hypothetical protein
MPSVAIVCGNSRIAEKDVPSSGVGEPPDNIGWHVPGAVKPMAVVPEATAPCHAQQRIFDYSATIGNRAHRSPSKEIATAGAEDVSVEQGCEDR